MNRTQHKIESHLHRISKSREFILYSPSREDVRNQRMYDSIPLILEPPQVYLDEYYFVTLTSGGT